jgi:hypothetical protein
LLHLADGFLPLNPFLIADVALVRCCSIIFFVGCLIKSQYSAHWYSGTLISVHTYPHSVVLLNEYTIIASLVMNFNFLNIWSFKWIVIILLFCCIAFASSKRYELYCPAALVIPDKDVSLPLLVLPELCTFVAITGLAPGCCVDDSVFEGTALIDLPTNPAALPVTAGPARLKLYLFELLCESVVLLVLLDSRFLGKGGLLFFFPCAGIARLSIFMMVLSPPCIFAQVRTSSALFHVPRAIFVVT